MRTIPDFLPAFTAAAEAFRPRVYPDSKGVPTIGYGATGADVFFGMPDWTEDQARQRLIRDLQSHAELLYARVDTPIIEAWTAHQYGALVDFVFNTGAGKDWTIWKMLNRGVTGEAITGQLKRFDKIKHEDGTVEILPGLDHRRAAETTLYNTVDMQPVAAIAMAKPPIEIQALTPPSSEIRAAATPPAPMPEKPLGSSKSFLTAVAAAILTAVTTALPVLVVLQDGVGRAITALAPLTGGSKEAASVAAAMATLSAVLSVAVPVLIAIKNRPSEV